MSKKRLVVGCFLAVLAACGSGDEARSGTRGAAKADGNAGDGNADESGANSDAGGTCNSCSVDTDCRNSCPTPAQSGYVWCCDLGLCFTWANTCPARTVDAGIDGSALNSGSDAEEQVTCPASADAGDDSGTGSGCSIGICSGADWAEWAMPNSPFDVAAGAPNVESYTINGDGTVTDDVTGLMWQQAAPSNGYAWADAKAYCTSLTLGGHNDWRLATYIELISIVDYSKNLPALDPTAFPGAAPVDVWSATLFAGSPTRAWELYFMAGDSGNDPVTYGNDVRCTRGPAASSSSTVAVDRYTIASDTVYDTKTRLTWQRTAPSGAYAWVDARSYCQGLALNDAGVWRLPTEKELLTIADVTKSTSPAIDCTAFPGARANVSWSATPFAGFTPSTPFAWAVRFDTANPVSLDVSSSNSVRCVR